MHPLRRLILANRHLAAAILAVALLMKVVVPSGFMPTVANGRIVVSLCADGGPVKMVMTIPGLKHQSDENGQHGKSEQPCAFAGLSAPSLAAADPVLLALALLFVLALALRPAASVASTTSPYLRPPLRGPPAF